MQFPAMVHGTLIRRYKRFLADVVLEGGSEVTAHCANTGAMTGCATPGCKVWLTVSNNPRRKYRYSWQLLETPEGDTVCIHSALANKVVAEAVECGQVPALAGYAELRSEVKYGNENSRIDLLLRGGEAVDCYVEVKCVTLHVGGGVGLFPDTVSDRGRRHLRELISVRQQGHRAVLLFCVQHTAVSRVAPADSIDPAYGETLREAIAAGVEVLVYRCIIDVRQMTLSKALPFIDRQP